MGEADTSVYDTKGGIATFLTDLEHLNTLVRLRCEAHYDRDEHLHEFVVLGCFWLNACGDAYKATGNFIPRIAFPEISAVLTRAEFWEYFRERLEGIGMDPGKVTLGWSLGSDIPPVRVVCPECGQPWTIENCHDTSVEDGTEAIPLSEFIGRTLGEVRSAYADQTDVVYRLFSDCAIRGKADDHWRGKQDGITDDYVIREGDEALFYVWRYFHKACRRRYNARAERVYFKEILAAAGFEQFKLYQARNRYCQCEACAPWFLVHTPIGRILIGWRKRVIHIDWSETAQDFLPLFKGECVTKGAGYIHAWGREKAIEYLSRILESVVKGLPESLTIGQPVGLKSTPTPLV